VHLGFGERNAHLRFAERNGHSHLVERNVNSHFAERNAHLLKECAFALAKRNVAYPWHFGTDPDPGILFCLLIEGFGSVTLTNRSGSRRSKNIRILRIRIRIRNTGERNYFAWIIHTHMNITEQWTDILITFKEMTVWWRLWIMTHNKCIWLNANCKASQINSAIIGFSYQRVQIQCPWAQKAVSNMWRPTF
jgi:hypothetical protein